MLRNLPDLAFLAFLPTFVNVGSTLNNDAAVVLFCTLAVRFFFIGLESFSLKNALGFGVAMGLALFSKVNAIFLFPAFGLIAFMHRAKLKPVRNILWAGLPILVFAILLIIRNVLVFGEVTAINPGAPKQWDISVSHILWAFRNLSWSFIFAFGRTYEIQPDMWLLITPALLFVVFIFRYFRDSLRPKQTEPLALFTAVGLASLIAASLYYTLSYPEGSMTSWGKNLYPALLPLSAIVGLGVAKAGKSGIAGFITYMLLVIYGLITVIQFMA